MTRKVTVVFWQTSCASFEESYDTKVEAKRAIAAYINGRLYHLRHTRPCFEREGSAYRDGAVTVKHKAFGREFGAYIEGEVNE